MMFFIGLISWLSMLIINTNNIITDQNSLQKVIKEEINDLKLSTTKIENFDSNRLLSLSDIEKLKDFQIDHEPQLIYKVWFLGIWVLDPQRGLRLQEIHLQAIMFFMASGLKMHKVRMLLQAYELLIL